MGSGASHESATAAVAAGASEEDIAAHLASQAAIRTRIELARLRPSGHALLSVARNARRHGEHVAGRACARRRGARRLHLSRSPVVSGW